jgi:hypothetical protein
MAPENPALMLFRNAIEPLTRDRIQFPEAARIHDWLTAASSERATMFGSIWETTEALLGKLKKRPDLADVSDRLVAAWSEVNRVFI